MPILEYKGYDVTISPEALMIQPLGILWKRDKSATKKRALKELAYIYFMYDPRSDYRVNTIDEEERRMEIIRDEGIDPAWTEDRDVKNAIEFYKNQPFMNSEEMKSLDTALKVLGNIRTYCDTLKFEEQEDPVKALKIVGDTMNAIPRYVANVKLARQAVFESMKDSGRMRGGRSKKIGEDGLAAFTSNNE